MRKLPLLWFGQLEGVILPREIIASLFRDRIDAPAEVLDESGIGEENAPILDVLGSVVNTIVIGDLGREFGAPFFEQFQNALVDEYHPLGRKTHSIIGGFRWAIVTSSDIIIGALPSIVFGKITLLPWRIRWLCTRDQFADPSLMGPSQKRTPLQAQRARVRSRGNGTRPMHYFDPVADKGRDRPTNGHTIIGTSGSSGTHAPTAKQPASEAAGMDDTIDRERVRREVGE